GVAALFETATAALMPPSTTRRSADKAALVAEVDMVVVLGGDGTLLSMADCIAAAGKSIPMLGVNFGSLGFLTEVTLPELYPSLETVLAGKALVDERLMLAATVRRPREAFSTYVALNDAVVAKTARSRTIGLYVSVG